MSRAHLHAASTVSRRRLLTLAAGGTLAIISADRLHAAAQSTPIPESPGKGTFLDADVVHDIAVTFEQSVYDAMVETYANTGDKEWIEATVAIDGATYASTGMRLKGNSSLMGLRMAQDDRANRGAPLGGAGGNLAAEEPEGLPWLIRLDKYDTDQRHGDITELVIRSNPSATSLNEAVALELLAAAGLASQRAAATAFRVNSGAPALRLAIEHPNDAWMAAHFSADGLLYKSEATGNWTYRGDDPAAYKEVFDLEAGGTGDDAADMAPLVGFLDFLNNSKDATFIAELSDRLDVDQFAIYLAMMDLIVNFDDIDGPGNNAYLYYDPAARRFTVVPWDMNLAFSGAGAG
ncbi:MAG: CotH kinase family protein, partial [Chloroflexota bacterium]|nr:CotH kinase family protein [Chloroflexota bacterium]